MTLHQPPNWLTKFLRWYCREDLVDAIEGDLLDLYNRRVGKLGKFRANWLYLWNVITFFQPFVIKRNEHPLNPFTSIDMLSNYLKIAFRTLKASKAFTVINIMGLAIGISASILMTTFVAHELSYDEFHEKKERIFRLSYKYIARGEETHVSRTAFPLKRMILDQYPEVEKIVRFYQNRMDLATLRYGDQVHTEEYVFFTDPEIFEVFDFKLEQGNPATALTDARSIVLTRKAATKYFGEEDPMGKILEFKEGEPLKVTGILREVPSNSHIPIEVLLPVELQRRRWMRGAGNNGYDLEEDWRWSGAWTYILLKDKGQLEAFIEPFAASGIDFFGRMKGSEIAFHYEMTNLTDLYFQSAVVSQIGVHGNVEQVYAFSAIALLILAIACINFVNLSTARATKRAKEVGLRKVLGAIKRQLIVQFVTESVLVCGLAALVGVLLVEALLPWFNRFVGREITVGYWQHPEIFLYLLAGVVLVGILAGLYPSFYLSAFQPAKTLKGNYEDNRKGHIGLRKALVLAQFIVCNLMIIAILVMQQQLNFIKNKDLGFDKEKIILLTHGSKLSDEFKLLSSRIKALSGVAKVNRGYVAGEKGWQQSFRVNGESTHEGKSLGLKMISFDFVDMYDLEVLAGRNFDPTFGADSTGSALLNESALQVFGWTPDQALGQEFSYIGGNDNKTRFALKVVGVLKDANFESLYDPVRPSVFQLGFFGDVAVKLDVNSRKELFATIDQVQGIWEEVAPKWPFEYRFLDQQIAEQYKKDNLQSDMIGYFGILAIFIAGLGLFGLASFTVQRRTKEIGVRKVMGASIRSLLMLIVRGFVVLVLVSFVVSVPLGYYFSNSWLEDFAFRISLSPGTFIIAGFISLFIAMLAVLYQSTRAALADPIDTLRYE